MTKRSRARVVTFDETLLRISASDGIRLAASRTPDATFGKGEANVAMSLGRSEIPATASALPHNDLGEAAWSFRRGGGVDDAGIATAPGRILGLGAAQRASRGLYPSLRLRRFNPTPSSLISSCTVSDEPSIRVERAA